jgi:hypothetical protein
VKRVALVLVVLAALLLSVVPLVSAKGDILLHKVDIGNPTSEAGNVMAGWGPIEPATHGGNWGGFNVTGEDCRVIWDISDDDPSATITLDRGVRPGAATAIRMRHLDGLADDSFDVYVKDVHGTYVKIGSWAGSPGPEKWVIDEFALPNGNTLQLARGRDVEVELVATGQEWSGFGTYGQVAFDWIELVGNGKK